MYDLRVPAGGGGGGDSGVALAARATARLDQGRRLGSVTTATGTTP